MALGTPKFKSGEFKRVLAELKSVFDAHSLGLILLDALERKSAEDLVTKFGKGVVRARLRAVPKTELAGQITGWFFQSDQVAHQVVKDLDRSCEKERHIVSSIPEEHAKDRIGSYRAITLKRERAKLVWALARDEREPIRALANKIISEFFLAVADHERAKEAVEEHGSLQDDVELAKRIQAQAQQLSEASDLVSNLESKLSSAQEERAKLLAAMGSKEREAQEASEARGELESQLAELNKRLKDLGKKEQDAELARARERAAQAEMKDMAQKVRRLEKLAGVQDALKERERELSSAKETISSIERDLARLKADRDKDADEHDKETKRLEQQVEELKDELKRARIQLQKSDEREVSEEIKGKVLVLLDQANLAASAHDSFKKKVDFGRVLERAAEGRKVHRAIAFVVDNGGAGFESFCDALRRFGWDLRVKKPKRFADGSTKADWDIEIALEAVDHRDEVETVVVASGDGDFAPLLRYLKKRGVRAEVAAFADGLAIELENAADRVMRLDESTLE